MWDHLAGVVRPPPPPPLLPSSSSVQSCQGAAARCGGLLVIIRSRLHRCVCLSKLPNYGSDRVDAARFVGCVYSDFALACLFAVLFILFYFLFSAWSFLDYRCPATRPPDNSECRNQGKEGRSSVSDCTSFIFYFILLLWYMRRAWGWEWKKAPRCLCVG